MRDPSRIDKVLNRIKNTWQQNPDLRLGQMLVAYADKENKNLFYIEDEDLAEVIEKGLKNDLESQSSTNNS